MKEQNCSIERAEFYVNDLFEMLELKGNNQRVFNQIVQILLKQTEKTIKENWKHIVFACEMPNGQMAGKLPKLEFIDRMFKNNKFERSVREHEQHKKEITDPGTINQLYNLGKKLVDNEITRKEFDEAIRKISK